jgi:hypothetical protein
MNPAHTYVSKDVKPLAEFLVRQENVELVKKPSFVSVQRDGKEIARLPIGRTKTISLSHAIHDLKDQYVQILLDRARAGDVAAMERLDRLTGV